MIATTTLVARLLLGVVLAVAGAAKLVDRPGTRKAIVDFGGPEGLAGPLAVALPLAELASAALLLPASTAVAGAVSALALLILFSAVILVSLARGRAPECHCFGQLHSARAGWRTLIRNVLLTAVAAFAVGGGIAASNVSALAWAGRLNGSEQLALGVALCATSLLVVGGVGFVSLARSYGQALVRLERIEQTLTQAGFELEAPEEPPEIGLEPGSPAPSFATATLAGGEISLGDLTSSGVPTLLLFTSPSCGPCKALLPEAAAWQSEHADELRIAFVTDGDADEIREEAEGLELANVLLDPDGRLYALFEASGTPSAVLIAGDGTIDSWVTPGAEWIRALVARTLAGALEDEQGAALPVGSEAPALGHSSLAGGTVTLADFRGRETLLLFWNPGCGYCRSMHEELLAWERASNGNSPRLVVVSSGDEESSRAEGFASTVLLDAEFSVGAAFGAGGTPMGVLLDADGRVASRLATGSDDVLALARNGGGS